MTTTLTATEKFFYAGRNVEKGEEFEAEDCDVMLLTHHHTPKATTAEIPVPFIESIDPVDCSLGSADFTVYLYGDNFAEGSVIVFAGQDEPTTYDNADDSLSTGVNMAMWHGPDTVKVSVRNGGKLSNEVDFTFLDPAAQRAAPKQKPRPRGYKRRDMRAED